MLSQIIPADSSFSAQAMSAFFANFLGNEVVQILLLLTFGGILFSLFASCWFHWREEVFKHSIKWTMLEIKIPREVKKNAQGMEQILGAIHALRNAASDLQEIFWDGEITRWYALEIASFGGEVHFYIRFYHKQRPIIEAAFYSYYPDIELVEVEDYVKTRFPQSVPEMHAQGYDVWGVELELDKEAAYPIKSYRDFESPDEEKQYDPMSAFLEVLGKAKKEEVVGIQILIQPATTHWHHEYESLVTKLSKKRGEKVQHSSRSSFDFPGGPLPVLSTKHKEDEKWDFSAFVRTPGETDVLEAVERNLSKPAFETIIRYIYFSPRSLFWDGYPRRGIWGCFNQYAALNLNRFVRNEGTSSRVKIWDFPYIFPHLRKEFRNRRLLYNYAHRQLPDEQYMGKLINSSFFHWNIHSKLITLSSESIATVFHPPTHAILTGPHIQRVESRKGGPPAGLLTYGDDKEIEKFM